MASHRTEALRQVIRSTSKDVTDDFISKRRVASNRHIMETRSGSEHNLIT